MANCIHLLQLNGDIKAGKDHCEECVKTNSTWVHLRVCQDCGTTLCCDSSPNKHANAHYTKDGHCIIASAEPGEHWLWCYEDKVMKNY